MLNASKILWLQGGLGNQLFQLNGLLNSVRETEATAAIATYSFNRDAQRNFELKPLISDVLITNLIQNLLLGPPFRKNGQLRLRTAPTRLPIVDNVADARRTSRGVMLVGYFQDQGSLSFGVDDVLSRMRSVQLSDAAKRLSARISGNPVAHVRRSDYVTLKSAVKTFGVTKPEYYRDAADKLDLSLSDFFFFTDDPDWVAGELGVERNKIVTSSQLRSPLENILVMGASSDLVFPNSTFSWWASELVSNNGRVVGPQRWFFDRPDERAPLRDHWIRLDE